MSPQRNNEANAWLVARWLANTSLEDLEHELDELAGSEGQVVRDAEQIIDTWIRVAFKVTGCEDTPEEERNDA